MCFNCILREVSGAALDQRRMSYNTTDKPKPDSEEVSFGPRSYRETAERQIETLGVFITSNVPGEPSKNQGAVDTAIRVITDLQRHNRRLIEQLEYSTDSYRKENDRLILLHNEMAAVNEQYRAEQVALRSEIVSLTTKLDAATDFAIHLAQSIEN